MFQLFQSHKEEIKEIGRILDNAYMKGLPAYQREISKLLDEAERNGDQDLSSKAELATTHYLERIAVMVDGVIRKSPNEEIRNRYAAAKESPKLAAVQPKEDGSPYAAGELFCFLYYAYTGKKTMGQEIQRQDFLLGAYIDRALNQLERPV